LATAQALVIAVPTALPQQILRLCPTLIGICPNAGLEKVEVRDDPKPAI